MQLTLKSITKGFNAIPFTANFLVQFLILSFTFGIPLLWLQMVLGQKIKGGIVTMYRITPICKGIGVALMISHSIISLYSSVSIAWLLIYLRCDQRIFCH